MNFEFSRPKGSSSQMGQVQAKENLTFLAFN